ncbi:MAG: amidohydrolase family protein [Actinomycetota bacterium]|nr:amidohydrolase family protein [Actinomycetota bacterium]
MSPARAVDALGFVGTSLFGTAQSYGELRRRLDDNAVDAAVVAAARPVDYHLRPANDEIARLQETDPARVVGLGRVDANRADAADETRRCLETLALRGIFLHPHEEVFPVNAPRVDAVLEVCAERGAPVLVAAGYPWVSEALQVAELATRHSTVSIAMTHGGQQNISGLGQMDALLALRKCPNVLVQTNGVYRRTSSRALSGTSGAVA